MAQHLLGVGSEDSEWGPRTIKSVLLEGIEEVMLYLPKQAKTASLCHEDTSHFDSPRDQSPTE